MCDPVTDIFLYSHLESSSWQISALWSEEQQCTSTVSYMVGFGNSSLISGPQHTIANAVFTLISYSCPCRKLLGYVISSLPLPPFTSGWPDWKWNRPSHIYLLGRGGLFSLPPHRGSCLSLPDPPQSSAFACTFPNHLAVWLPPACCMWSTAKPGGRTKQPIFTPIHQQPRLTSHRGDPTASDPFIKMSLCNGCWQQLFSFIFQPFFQEAFAS